MFWFEMDSGALALSFRCETPLADCRLEFTYYLSEGSSVRAVNLGLNVPEWNPGRRTLRPPPVTGRWRNRNNNLMNYTGANWSLETLSTGLTMKVRMPSTGFMAGGGLDVSLRKSVACGNVFSRVDPISVSDDEFCCSASSFFGG